MITRLVVWFALIGIALAWPATTYSRSERAARPVLAIQVEGVIAPSAADYIIRAIKQADREMAQALVIELDTPGGLDLSMRPRDWAITTK